MPEASAATKDYVRQYIADRVTGDVQKPLAPSQTHYINPSADPQAKSNWNDWGKGMEQREYHGEYPLDGNLNPSASYKPGHVFGLVKKNADGTDAKVPQPYTITYDLDQDGVIEPGETSDVYDPRPVRLPVRKPNVPEATEDELENLSPSSVDDDASNINKEQLNDARDLIGGAKEEASPLVLDIDGSGTIELASLSSVDAVYFNFNPNDVFAEATGWAAGGDGFLAIDLNSDGIINNGGELFGDQTGYDNGFQALAAYDSNGDGVISSEDQVWNELRVWVDANQNGYSEEDELHTLDSFTITAINLAYTEVNYDIAGNNIRQESVFTMGGLTYDVVDVYFQVNEMNALYNEEFVHNLWAENFVDAHGYGLIPSLYISISLDNDVQDSDSLISLVDNFSELTTAEIFASDTVAMDAVRAIMYRWANVEDINPTSRGEYVDAQELGFLEAMTGQPFLQQGYRSDPLWNAGADLTEAFELAHNHFFATLVAQTAAGELFTGDFYYNISTDSFEGITGLNTTVLDDLETTATGLANTAARELLWSNVVRVIEYTVGVDELETGDLIALGNAINGSDPSLNTGDIMELIIGEPALNAIDGTSSAETLAGTSGADYIRAYGGDDIIDAGAGNDEVYAGHGSDTITGGAGSDYLNGDYNGDTYIYNPGDGVDIIDDAGGTTGDKILFGAGIDAGDVTITRVGRYDLEISIDNGVDVGQIVISNQFGNYGAIETIAFDDTTTIDLTALSANDNDEFIRSPIRRSGGV